MADKTGIEWCDSTFNPWEGCQKVGPGCDHCYAEARNKRFSGGVAANWGPGAPRRLTSHANWRKPLQWNARAAVAAAGWAEGVKLYGSEKAALDAGHIKPRRPRVFCASLADVFDNAAPAEWRSNLMRLILDTPHLDWLLLTKRVGNVTPMLSEIAGDLQLLAHHAWDGSLPGNVWLGATVVNQEEADRDIPKLLAVPARVRFLSIEPMLGPVDLTRTVVHRGYMPPGARGPARYDYIDFEAAELGLDATRRGDDGSPAVDWVIVGGESGPKARPMHPDWVRRLRDQCARNRVPFLFKQWGEFMPPESPTTQYPADQWRDVVDATGETRPVHFVGDAVLESSRLVVRVGKKAAGRLLDGRTHDEFPA